MNDSDQLYNALRKADAAGDTAGAKRLADYIRSLQPATPSSPKTSADIPGQPNIAKPQEEPTLGQKALGAGEAALSLGTGLVGGVAGGVAGAYKAATGGKFGTAQGVQEAENTSGNVSSALTYQPRTQTGQEYTEKAADVLSQIPPVMPEGVGGIRPAGRYANSIAEEGTIKARQLAQSAYPKGAETVFLSTAKAAEKAKQVLEKAGHNWESFPMSVRQKITDLAKNATEFDKLSPDAIVRQARLSSLPVPTKGTLGQLTRNPVQLRTEQQLAQTDAGEPIRNMHIQQNQDLNASLDVVKGNTGAKSHGDEAVGKSVSGALEKKASNAIKKYQDSYNAADKAGELEEKISPYPLIDHVMNHEDPTMIPYVANKLVAMKVATKDANGMLVPISDMTVKQAEQVRKAASNAMRAGGEKAYHAGQVADVIGGMTEGKGGEAYAKARNEFKNFKLEFDEQKAVKNLVGMKNRMDRTTSIENIFNKTILGGDAQSFRQIKRSLLTGGDKETKALGVQAWKDLRGRTADWIKEESHTLNPDELGNPHIIATKMQKAFDKIGDERLNELFGKPEANRLRNILSAVKDLKTSPPARITGSDTAVNLMTIADKILDHIPIAGPIVKGAAKLTKQAYKAGTTGKNVKRAINPSLKDFQG